MKNYFFYLTLLSLVFTSCKSKDPEPSDATEVKRETLTLNYTMTHHNTYSQNLAVTELKDAEIITTPSHASISTITAENSSLEYQYQPETGYVGKDTTVIETCVSYEGETCTYYKEYNIFFDVKEPTIFTIISDTCSEMSFQQNLGSNFTEGLEGLKTLRAASLGNINYTTNQTVATVENPIVGRTYTAITFLYSNDNSEVFSTRDVIDSEGNYFIVISCITPF